MNFKIPLISKNKIGFRLSLIDVIVIITVITLTILFKGNSIIPFFVNDFFHYLPLYILSNFFLFCNLFRVRNKYELFWCLSAIINTILFLFKYNDVNYFFITQSLITIVVIILEINNKNYHGIFAKRIV